MSEFHLIKKSKKSRARLGVLRTSHGEVATPALVPVATQATVKTLTSDAVRETNTQMLIANTFHLHLKPGEKIVRAAGGLHSFMQWDRPLMTDSGGYQVFSFGFGRELKIGKMLMKDKALTVTAGHQPKAARITREGVFFRSPVDGAEVFLGPRESMEIQRQLGADIAFAFDECPPPVADYAYTKKSMDMTHRWATLCLQYARMRRREKGPRQALYGIVQGGKFKALREKSARFIGGLDFDGFGIGGELGFDKKTMFRMLGWVTTLLPDEKPRHLLGNGHLDDLRKIFASGVDTVDCIIPTHYARHGVAFTSKGRLDMAKARFLHERKPLDAHCACKVCGTHTRSYLAHLFRAKEITALSLLTFHNLFFFNAHVENIRRDIAIGKL